MRIKGIKLVRLLSEVIRFGISANSNGIRRGILCQQGDEKLLIPLPPTEVLFRKPLSSANGENQTETQISLPPATTSRDSNRTQPLCQQKRQWCPHVPVSGKGGRWGDGPHTHTHALGHMVT